MQNEKPARFSCPGVSPWSWACLHYPSGKPCLVRLCSPQDTRRSLFVAEPAGVGFGAGRWREDGAWTRLVLCATCNDSILVCLFRLQKTNISSGEKMMCLFAIHTCLGDLKLRNKEKHTYSMNYFMTGTLLNDLHIQLRFISNLPKKNATNKFILLYLWTLVRQSSGIY